MAEPLERDAGKIPPDVQARMTRRIDRTFERLGARRARRRYIPNVAEYSYEIALASGRTLGLLRMAGYCGPHRIAHATDDELLKIAGMGKLGLQRIRSVIPYVPWSDDMQRAYERGVSDGRKGMADAD